MSDEPIIRLTPLDRACAIAMGAIAVVCGIVGVVDAVRGGLGL